jgi:hypothetical protein
VYILPPAGLQFFAIHDSINPKRMMAWVERNDTGKNLLIK